MIHIYRLDGGEHVLKVYELGLPIELIRSYHERQQTLSGLQYKPIETWKSKTDLCDHRQELFWRRERVSGMTCSILGLSPDEVFFGKVDGYCGSRVVARARYIEGATLQGAEYGDPLMKEIETRLSRMGVPIGRGQGVFVIDPINVKVLDFKDRILGVMITDLGANIRVSMTGHC